MTNPRAALGWLAGIVLACFLVFDVVLAAGFIASLPDLYPDFAGTWSFARFVAEYPAVLLYDAPTLLEFQRRLLPGMRDFYPFPYPPSFLLLIAPLGALAFPLAYGVWSGLGFVAWWGLSWKLIGGRVAGVALAVAPACALTVVYGQSGFLTGALTLAGLLALPSYPVIAGVLFGVLTVKPQLGLPLAVALLALRAWRAIAAAVAIAGAMVLAAVALHGWEAWPAWLDAMATHTGVARTEREKYAHIMVTPLAALTKWGAEQWLAITVQAVVGVLVAVAIWRAFRRGISPLAVAGLCVGTFMMTPYAFVYDTPLAVTGALLFLATRARLGGLDIAVGTFTLLSPVFVFADRASPPVVAVMLALLFARITWVSERQRRGLHHQG